MSGTTYETFGGYPTKALAYSKALDLLSQVETQFHVLSHIQIMEDDDRASVTAQGFRAMGELTARLRSQLTELATGGKRH